MEKEFIPYTEALALKELGFDKPCLKNWDSGLLIVCDYATHLKAPLYQQAFRFFREKYGLSGWINDAFIGDSRQGVISIKSEIGFKYYPTTTKFFDTYEEAELECLKKLIKIVKFK